MKRIAFVNGKGGCGKTTGIFNVSGVLASRGEKVLVIDLDKQRNSTGLLTMNTPESEMPKKTVFDFLMGEAEPDEVVAKAYFQSRGNANPKHYGVSVMVADKRLQDEARLQSVDGEAAGRRLMEYAEQEGYGWILVDMPPSNMALNNVCFRYFVDFIIIPFSSDMFSVDGYGDIMDVMDTAREQNPMLSVMGVYLSRFRRNEGLEQYIKEQLSSQFPTFIDIQIPYATDVRESVMFGRPISFFKQGGKSKAAYEALTDFMTRKEL